MMIKSNTQSTISLLAEINQEQVLLIIDTGLTYNVISESRAAELDLHIEPLAEPINIQTANKDQQQIKSKAHTVISFIDGDDKHKLDTVFLIAPNFVSDIIIGLEFLKNSGVNILISDNKIKFPNFEV